MTFWLFLWISCKLPNTTALNMTTSVRISYLWRRLLDMKNQRGTYPSSQSDQTSSQTFQYTGFLISLNSPASTHFTLTPPHTFSRVFGSSFHFYIYMYLFSFLSLHIHTHTQIHAHFYLLLSNPSWLVPLFSSLLFNTTMWILYTHSGLLFHLAQFGNLPHSIDK